MKRRMIVIISLHADPSEPPGVGGGGGTHIYVRELMSGLGLRGRNCAVITRRSSPSLPEYERISRKAELFRIDIGPLGPMDKRRLDEFHDDTKQEIRRILKTLKPSPGLFHSVYWNSGHAAMDLSREFGLYYVHTVISNGFRRQLEGAKGDVTNRVDVEREVFDKAFRIFSISNSEKKDLVDFYGVDPDRIVVVGRVVNDVFLCPAHDEVGNPRGVVLGNMRQGDIV